MTKQDYLPMLKIKTQEEFNLIIKDQEKDGKSIKEILSLLLSNEDNIKFIETYLKDTKAPLNEIDEFLKTRPKIIKNTKKVLNVLYQIERLLN